MTVDAVMDRPHLFPLLAGVAPGPIALDIAMIPAHRVIQDDCELSEAGRQTLQKILDPTTDFGRSTEPGRLCEVTDMATIRRRCKAAELDHIVLTGFASAAEKWASGGRRPTLSAGMRR